MIVVLVAAWVVSVWKDGIGANHKGMDVKNGAHFCINFSKQKLRGTGCELLLTVL
jgi:hypothetical protein